MPSAPEPRTAAALAPPLPDSWSRAVITVVEPHVDHGRWPVKRARGQAVEVCAGVIVDGHEELTVELRVRREGQDDEVMPMTAGRNDEYTATFVPEALGPYQYRVRAWIDRFGTWQDQFRRRVAGGEAQAELESELLDGAALLKRAARHAEGADRKLLQAHAEALEGGAVERAQEEGLATLARTYLPDDDAAESRWYDLWVDPPHAAFAAWYEFFPRSARDDGQHGTLDDAAERLPRIKEMGFDIVYLPPIHPIGETHRKGKDNAPTAEAGDPGSPWAIGGAQADGSAGGHTSVHPDLGGMEAFERFVARAEELGLQVALDAAFQTSPDHPYVEAHPEWFYKRPDGSIRYAENPPKKYQDVYPLKFEGDEGPALWEELRDVFAFWIERGVTVFRVDNPHTKPFAFWQWCIASLRAEHPEVVFLAEAFTRPKTMYHLAKIGFNTSYTYFAWRDTRQEIERYGRELFQTEVAEFFRPNFWPNTPDILTDYLAHGGRPAHQARFVLAATLSPTYGVYGPPYEHVDNRQHPDREEYAHNEKYEVRTWDWNDPHSLQPLMRRVNRIRKENPALQHLRGLRFHETLNERLVAYTRHQEDNLILVVVNLDPYHVQEGQVVLPLHEFGMSHDHPFEVHDLLGGERYHWHGARNFIRLAPHPMPAHVFRIQTHRRTEADYDNIVN